MFWFGDLNFRIQDHGIHFVRSCISSQNYNLLWSKDQVRPAPEALAPLNHQGEESAGMYDQTLCLCQLNVLKDKEELLQQFEEGPLEFQPTYKFDLNSDTYDSR